VNRNQETHADLALLRLFKLLESLPHTYLRYPRCLPAGPGYLLATILNACSPRNHFRGFAAYNRLNVSKAWQSWCSRTFATSKFAAQLQGRDMLREASGRNKGSV